MSVKAAIVNAQWRGNGSLRGKEEEEQQLPDVGSVESVSHSTLPRALGARGMATFALHSSIRS